MELDGLGGHLHSGLGAEELGHSGVGAVGDAVVFLVVCRAAEQTGGLHFGLEVGHLELRVLELGDAAAELLALLGVLDGLVHSTLGDAEGLAGDTDTAAVEGLHGEAEAFAQLTQLTVFRDAAILEDKLGGGAAADTHLLLLLADAEAGVGLLDDEGADALGAEALVGHGDDDEHVGVAAVGDENLAAVEHPLVAVEDSGGLLTGGVGTGVGLGEAEGADPLAAGELGQVLHLLLLGAGLKDGGGAEAGVGGEDDARGGADAAELLDGHAVHDVGAAGTAVLRGDGDAHQADLGHLLNGLHGETLLLVDFGGEGLDLLLCKLANHLQEEFFLFGEAKIHILCFWDYKSTRLRVYEFGNDPYAF